MKLFTSPSKVDRWIPRIATPWTLMAFLAIRQYEDDLFQSLTLKTISQNWIALFKDSNCIFPRGKLLGHCRFLSARGFIHFAKQDIQADTEDPFKLTDLSKRWAKALDGLPPVECIHWMVSQEVNDTNIYTTYWKTIIIMAADSSPELSASTWLSPGQIKEARSQIKHERFQKWVAKNTSKEPTLKEPAPEEPTLEEPAPEKPASDVPTLDDQLDSVLKLLTPKDAQADSVLKLLTPEEEGKQPSTPADPVNVGIPLSPEDVHLLLRKAGDTQVTLGQLIHKLIQPDLNRLRQQQAERQERLTKIEQEEQELSRQLADLQERKKALLSKPSLPANRPEA